LKNIGGYDQIRFRRKGEMQEVVTATMIFVMDSRELPDRFRDLREAFYGLINKTNWFCLNFINLTNYQVVFIEVHEEDIDALVRSIIEAKLHVEQHLVTKSMGDRILQGFQKSLKESTEALRTKLEEYLRAEPIDNDEKLQLEYLKEPGNRELALTHFIQDMCAKIPS
jgi:hypothetical protein